MLENPRDHIAVNLPISGNEFNDTNKSLQQHTRKSIRRYWKQLPRCQRNLIILLITSLCVTIVLLLPGEMTISDTPKESSIDHVNIAPFKEHDRRLKVRHINENEKKLDNEQQLITPDSIQIQSIKIKPINKDIQEDQIISNSIDEPKIEIKPSVNENELLEKSNLDIIEDAINRLEENTDATPKDFKGATNDRQKAVIQAFKHSWSNYKEYAWGHDNLKPISMTSNDWFGLGLTIVDSLDSMYIMDLQEELEEARNWVDQYLTFDINRDVNLFEVTIRVLGGLLSSYHLSGDKMFLKKSLELGFRLLPCFNSQSGIPYSDINLATMTAHSPKWSPDSSTSEVTTLQLEFRDLSRITGNNKFEEVVQLVNSKVHDLEKTSGLVPIFINANTGNFRSFSTISLGARGDSYYEYLLKQWIQTGRKDDDFLILDYKTAIDGVIKLLVKKTPNEQLTYIGELINGKDFKPKMDHLTCYLPGTLILGHKYGMPDSHLQLATDLLETCYQTYMKQSTGLAPEITYFNMVNDGTPDIQVKSNDAHNLQRPEFVESLYYFYALTGNQTYQDMGWNVFQAFEKYTKVKSGYTSIGNVKSVFNTRPRDMMESYWLGETLKYFYLLFSDDRNEIDLDKYVFNTEAHPLPIRTN